MRMRRKKNLVPRMERCAAYQVKEPEAMRGRWKDLYPQAEEIWVEIGCGKGSFTAETARQNPQALLIAVERVADAMVMAMEKAQALELKNVFFICADAARLGDIFAPGETDRIFLNFSDPWPKDRHAKRRLTSTHFLAMYEELLSDGGQVEFKTDNRSLFDFSLAELELKGWELLACTYDLHADPALNEGNIMTEYEQRFSEEGVPICKYIARPGR